MTTYLVHGLRFDSEIPLAAPEVEGPADYRVAWGDSIPAGPEPPPGELLATVNEDGVAYSVSRDGDGIRLRLHGTAEFRVGADDIRVHMDPGADPGLAAVLLTGNVPAVIHTSRGECVIHASAVAFDEGAIALVGGSGAGKSTLSAICCAAGARMVSEDLLRVRMDGAGGAVALPGVAEIRLRPGVAELAARFSPEAVRTTADGRTAIRFPPAREAPLCALLVPEPSRDVTGTESVRLSPAEALVELGRYPRVLGWRTRDVRAARFRILARLARTLPVVRVRIPWGPPFPPAIPQELLAAAEAGA